MIADVTATCLSFIHSSNVIYTVLVIYTTSMTHPCIKINQELHSLESICSICLLILVIVIVRIVIIIIILIITIITIIIITLIIIIVVIIIQRLLCNKVIRKKNFDQC